MYVCYSESLHREVAVKVLEENLRSGNSMKRFQSEAQALSQCRHPSIVRILSFGVCPDGRPYYAMDYLPGLSLSDELKANGPLSPKRFAGVFRDVLGALAVAHGAGFVHRDIKPSNIMLTMNDGLETAVLIDFGVIKRVDGQKLTATDTVLGTPHYMSPEQCTGRGGNGIDARSDLYSLGCTMYESAIGAPPFVGETMEVLMAHLNSRAENMPAILAPFLDKCLAKDRADRFADASEALSCLDSLELEKHADFAAAHRAKPVAKRVSGKALKGSRLVLIGGTVVSAVVVVIALASPRISPPPIAFEDFRVAIRQGKVDAAERVLESFTASSESPLIKVNELTKLARLQIEHKRLQSAWKTANQALTYLDPKQEKQSIDPRMCAARCLAVALERQGKRKEAAKYYEEGANEGLNRLPLVKNQLTRDDLLITAIDCLAHVAIIELGLGNKAASEKQVAQCRSLKEQLSPGGANRVGAFISRLQHEKGIQI